MSSTDDVVAQAARMTCCASCRKSEVDDVKLTVCAECKSVRYCSDACKEDHRPEHESKCKDRAAELRDEILFRQPESTHRGDCPICCLPLPIEDEKLSLYPCCGKKICHGCAYASGMRQWRENMLQVCLFCRHPVPKTDEESDKKLMKRVAANDPIALKYFGVTCFEGEEYDAAFGYFTKAAALGDADTHYNLSVMYMLGQGVEKDETKELYHLEEAAIAGHPAARHNLGAYECRVNKNNERAVKHFIIAANLGFDLSIKTLKDVYKIGLVSKEDFAAALRGHQAAVDAVKSPQREAAEISVKLPTTYS